MAALVKHINEVGDKYGYDTKVYNLLGVALMVMGDYEKANKVFEQGIEASEVRTPELSEVIFEGNWDLCALISNYFKC